VYKNGLHEALAPFYKSEYGDDRKGDELRRDEFSLNRFGIPKSVCF
jgi:hypothetical protein